MVSSVSGIAPEGISAVIAAHNEESSVAEVVTGLRRALPGLGEVLVVDDGSSDATGARAAAAGARVLRLAPNQGKGAALRAGVAAATGEILVFIDADGQDEPAELPTLLAALGPDVAMVIGSRFRGRLEKGAITRLNHLGNRALTGLFNWLHDAEISDTQAGFRVVRRAALPLSALRARRYEIETEMTLRVLAGGGRIVEVPVTRRARAGGRTGFVVSYDGLRILWLMLWSRWRRRRKGGAP